MATLIITSKAGISSSQQQSRSCASQSSTLPRHPVARACLAVDPLSPYISAIDPLTTRLTVFSVCFLSHFSSFPLRPHPPTLFPSRSSSRLSLFACVFVAAPVRSMVCVARQMAVLLLLALVMATTHAVHAAELRPTVLMHGISASNKAMTSVKGTLNQRLLPLRTLHVYLPHQMHAPAYADEGKRGGTRPEGRREEKKGNWKRA